MITVLLPRSNAHKADIADWPAPEAVEQAQAKTILVVEDDPKVAEATTALLDMIGYRTFHAENASEALARLGEGQAIDLVFSDVVMPGSMNGIDLAREIRARYPELPVLLSSGYSDQVQRTSHQFEILRKPLDVRALEKAISRVLAAAARSRLRDTGARRRPAQL